MLHAVSSYTAAELIVARANAGEPNMGLTSWASNRVRKKDVVTAKNYLGDAEISELNLIVTMFLDTADLRARRRQTMRLADWDAVLDWVLIMKAFRDREEVSLVNKLVLFRVLWSFSRPWIS